MAKQIFLQRVFAKVFSILTVSTIVVIGIWFSIFVQESEKLHTDYQIYLEQDGKDQVANGIGGKYPNL